MPFDKDLVDGVMDAASNILSALSNSSFPSMGDLFVSVKLAITQLLKVSVILLHFLSGTRPYMLYI